MSDTTKLILWIVLALVVILIVILGIRSASRRRQEEARRREATSLRAQARAAAERARGHEAEASRRSERAAELAAEAKAQETAAAAQQARQAALAQRADRIDPDVTEPSQGRGAEPRAAQRQRPPVPGVQPQGVPARGAESRGTPDRGAQAGGAVRAEQDRPAPRGGQPQSPRPQGSEPQRARPVAAQPGPVQPGSVQPGVQLGGAPGGARRAAPAIGLGLGAPDFDDDEPDLADADNPFGLPAKAQAGSSGNDDGPGHVPFDGKQAADRDDVVRDADAGAGDTRGPGPDQHVLETPEVGSGGVTPEPTSEPTERHSPDTTDRESTSEVTDPDSGSVSGARDVPEGAGRDDAGEGRQRGGEDDSATPRWEAGDDPDPQTEADWVNGPVDEAVPLAEAPDDDVVDWINGPEEAEPVTIEVPDRPAPQSGGPMQEGDRSAPQAGQSAPVPDMGESDPAAPSGPTDQVLAHLPEQPHAAPVEDEDADAERHPENDDDDHDDEVVGQGNPVHETAGRGQRLVSRLDEVVDGGHGVGSAAPIADGAQPLGHPIKAWRDTMTYVLPDGLGYDGGEPDIWFHSEQAAQAAGYRRGGA